METQKALRFTDVKDIGAVLVPVRKIETAQQATRKDRNPILAGTNQKEANLESIRKNYEENRITKRKVQNWNAEAADGLDTSLETAKHLRKVEMILHLRR